MHQSMSYRHQDVNEARDPLSLVPSAEDRRRAVRGDDPVGLVHDLADPQVTGEAEEQVGVDGGQDARETMIEMSGARAIPHRGPLALVGGGEFLPGNEPNDAVLVDAATRAGSAGPAFIVASAAAQQGPEQAVAMGRSWFGSLGLDMEELPIRNRDQAPTPRSSTAPARVASSI
jgi:hypothetical protein